MRKPICALLPVRCMSALEHIPYASRRQCASEWCCSTRIVLFSFIQECRSCGDRFPANHIPLRLYRHSWKVCATVGPVRACAEADLVVRSVVAQRIATTLARVRAPSFVLVADRILEFSGHARRPRRELQTRVGFESAVPNVEPRASACNLQRHARGAAHAPHHLEAPSRGGTSSLALRSPASDCVPARCCRRCSHCLRGPTGLLLENGGDAPPQLDHVKPRPPSSEPIADSARLAWQLGLGRVAPRKSVY